MKKIFYLFSILFILVGVFGFVNKINAVYYAAGGVFEQSPTPSSPTKSFTVFTALFGCPKYPIYDTDPNVTIADTVDASQVAQALKIKNPSGVVLTSPQDYTYSISSAGTDRLGWPLANYVITLNSTSSVGTYKINASISTQYNCPYNVGYSSTDYFSGSFVYNPSITTPPPTTAPNITSLTASPSPILRSNWAKLTWASNADRCVVSETGYTGGGNDSTDVYVRPLGNTDSESSSFTLQCDNSAGITTKTISVSQFHDLVHFNGYTLPNCSAPLAGAVAMSPNDPNVRFDVTITSGPAQTTIADYPTASLSNTPQKPNDFTWGPWDSYYPSKFTVTGKNVVPPNGYQYCSNSGSITNVRTNASLPPLEQEIKLYFAPIGGGIPGSPTNFAANGECHQNYPSASVQAILGWSPVSGASNYNVYRNGSKIANTINTWYIDQNVNVNSTYNYYVTSVNSSGESSPSNTISVKTPFPYAGDCDSPPPPPPGHTPTYVIDPPSATTTVGSTYQYNGLYDPDGTDIRYGNFKVNQFASWAVNAPDSSIASSQGSGLYLGKKSGTAGINSTYNSINATAILNVTNPPGIPDFLISISPNYASTTKPGSASYTISVTPSGGFTGNVALSISGLHSGTTGTPSPQTISTSGTSNLTLNVSSAAVIERYTFTVTGVSGTLNHSANADIDIVSSTPPPPGGFSCNLTANPSSSAPTQVSVGITGGTSPYRCYNWPGAIADMTCYGYNSTPTYTCGDSVNGCHLNIGVSDKNNNTTSCLLNINGTGVTNRPNGWMAVADGLNPATVWSTTQNNGFSTGFGGSYIKVLSPPPKYKWTDVSIDPLIVPYNYQFSTYPIVLSWSVNNVTNCYATTTSRGSSVIVGWSGSRNTSSNGETDYVQVPQPGQLLKNEPEIMCSTLDSQWGQYFGKSVYADIYRCAQNDNSVYSATCQSLTPASCTFTASSSSILTGQSSIQVFLTHCKHRIASMRACSIV